MQFVFVIVLAVVLILPHANSKGIIGRVINPENKEIIVQDDLKPFTSDGCSDYPDGTKEKPDLWLDCCIVHDSKYWLGGTEEERLTADQQLYQCVKSKGEPSHAAIMYAGVRAGGDPFRETDYRWGYGWTRLRGYKSLSEKEWQTVKSMYGENLEGLRELIETKKALVPEPASHFYAPELEYNFCEEQALIYLNDHLQSAAKITSVSKYEVGKAYHMMVGLDNCSDKIDFTFDEMTDAKTCRHDYLYSRYKNKIIETMVPKSCSHDFKKD